MNFYVVPISSAAHRNVKRVCALEDFRKKKGQEKNLCLPSAGDDNNKRDFFSSEFFKQKLQQWGTLFRKRGIKLFSNKVFRMVYWELKKHFFEKRENEVGVAR